MRLAAEKTRPPKTPLDLADDLAQAQALTASLAEHDQSASFRREDEIVRLPEGSRLQLLGALLRALLLDQGPCVPKIANGTTTRVPLHPIRAMRALAQATASSTLPRTSRPRVGAGRVGTRSGARRQR
ncbi:MAG: hypothetical protein KC561_03400 [Myxococcales bacterium]|nr:hypothetical protein [Myxococcales bacterium]